MTDLTEQWKKGELPEGVYYCNTGNTVETLFTWGKNYHQLTNNKDEVYIPEMDDCEVLAPVPSYDELQNMNKAVNECMAANIKLVEENKQLKEQINHLLKTQARQFVDNQKLQVKAEKAKDVVNFDTARQIKHLKELLKEWAQFEIEENPNDFTVMSERMSELANKTKEVLK